MTEPARRLLLPVALAIALGADVVQAGGPVLLTVAGAIENPNRGPVDPARDKLFAQNDVAFDEAMEFDADTLAAIPQATLTTDFPKGGETVEFTGPRLADVLAAAGATGETLTIQAMDGYAIEVPAADMLAHGAVVALARDGEPLGIDGLGPAMIVFPRGERADLAQMNDDWWIWQILSISVH